MRLPFGGAGACKAVTLWPFGSRGPSAGKKDATKSKRILIMMSNTGGGHRASAEAIKEAMQAKYGTSYEVLIEDMWKDHCPPPWNKIPDSYSFLVKHGMLWRASYMLMQPKWFHVPYLRAMHAAVARSLNKALADINPDLVVSVHPLMQHVPLRILKARIKSGASHPINFATVVTDFTTCHNTWFHPDATRCFVPTDFCKGLALNNGLQDEQILMHGLPIRPAFSRGLPSKKSLKRQLGLIPTTTPAVLLVGGGEGMGKLEETVDEMAAQLGEGCQAVVICGRNKQLLERLRSKKYASGMQVHALGFVDNMHEYMHAVDCVVTKAGPGTIAEALISGLPILLNGNIPCQEEGNIPYVVDNGAGAFETQPPLIAKTLARWLAPENRAEFEAMAARSKALGKPQGVFDIAEDLAHMAHVPDFKYGPAASAVEAGIVPRQRMHAAAAHT
ncbi:hypothetical protein FOA52_012897 [Chlamydomonas sp. UWO 241]|nr:hypothetical protein FOA52_012897 [Chlamydomonas sp. UWO 241]